MKTQNNDTFNNSFFFFTWNIKNGEKKYQHYQCIRVIYCKLEVTPDKRTKSDALQLIRWLFTYFFINDFLIKTSRQIPAQMSCNRRLSLHWKFQVQTVVSVTGNLKLILNISNLKATSSVFFSSFASILKLSFGNLIRVDATFGLQKCVIFF